MQQAYAIKFPFEDPFWSGEALLRERGGHGLNPIGELCHGDYY